METLSAKHKHPYYRRQQVFNQPQRYLQMREDEFFFFVYLRHVFFFREGISNSDLKGQKL